MFINQGFGRNSFTIRINCCSRWIDTALMLNSSREFLSFQCPYPICSITVFANFPEMSTDEFCSCVCCVKSQSWLSVCGKGEMFSIKSPPFLLWVWNNYVYYILFNRCHDSLFRFAVHTHSFLLAFNAPYLFSLCLWCLNFSPVFRSFSTLLQFQPLPKISPCFRNFSLIFFWCSARTCTYTYKQLDSFGAEKCEFIFYFHIKMAYESGYMWSIMI